MNDERKPTEYDLVLGGNNPPPIDGAVLGGIEGVRRRLSSDSEQVVIAAIKDTINYGEEGENLLFEIIETKSGNLLWEAFDLLWKTVIEEERQKELLKYVPRLIKDSCDRWDKWRIQDSNFLKLDFQGVDLREANLSSLKLIDIDFSGANLERANFSNASLHNVEFYKANLKNADFTGSQLAEINFNKANLTGVSFYSAYLDNINFGDKNLSGLHFSCALFGNVNLENANLTNTNFFDANLRRANLTNANLTNADLSVANLAYAKLEGAILDGANLEGAAIRGTVLCDYDECYEGDSYYEGSWE